MGSPVTSTDFSNQDTGAPLCDQFREKLLNNSKMQQLLDYLFDPADGSPAKVFVQELLGLFLPQVGQVSHYPFPLANADPGAGSGPVYLECDGTKRNIVDFQALADYLGQQCANEGPLDADGNPVLAGGAVEAGQFRLPYVKGRVLLGRDAGNGHESGQLAGEETHKLTGVESGIAQHRHGMSGNYTKYGGGGQGLNDGGAQGDGGFYTMETGPTDAANAHNNMPPFRTGVFYILAGYKVKGFVVGNALPA